MPLTRSFKTTVMARVRRDPEFAEALLSEGIQHLLDGDVETGVVILRDYINATVGFEELARASGTNAKSLMRMFSPMGNPQARNLFPVLAKLQEMTNRQIAVKVA